MIKTTTCSEVEILYFQICPSWQGRFCRETGWQTKWSLWELPGTRGSWQIRSSKSEQIRRYFQTEKVRLALGIRVVNDDNNYEVATIIKRNERIPASYTHTLHTYNPDLGLPNRPIIRLTERLPQETAPEIDYLHQLQFCSSIYRTRMLYTVRLF